MRAPLPHTVLMHWQGVWSCQRSLVKSPAYGETHWSILFKPRSKRLQCDMLFKIVKLAKGQVFNVGILMSKISPLNMNQNCFSIPILSKKNKNEESLFILTSFMRLVIWVVFVLTW